jgi:hypothetical protein
MSTTAYEPTSSLSSTCIPNPNPPKPENPLPAGFHPQLAYLLGLCCNAASDQYTKYVTNTPMNSNNPNDPKSWQIEKVEDGRWNPDLTQIWEQGYTPAFSYILKVYEKDINGKDVQIPAGFIVRLDLKDGGESKIVIAFHGTHNRYELDKIDNNVAAAMFNGNLGSVHAGFYALYTSSPNSSPSLAEQVRQCLAEMNDKGALPVKVTGHSMGGALATLCAADIAYNCKGKFQSISMYSLASPRVAVDDFLDSNSKGNAAKFVLFYQQNVPDSYRIVNTADDVPKLPPVLLLQYACAHVLGDDEAKATTPPIVNASPLDQNVINFNDPNKDRNANSSQECQGAHSCPAVYVPFLKNLVSNS